MRKVSPRRLAIILGILASATAIGGGFLVHYFDAEAGFYISLLFISLVVFIVIYLMVYYSLNHFITEKIKPIYKAIFDTRKSEEMLNSFVEDRDIIQDVQKDVLEWAKVKTREISQLRNLEKFRREFLGNVSHELKTPIFNIQGYITTLLDGGLEDKRINRKYLQKAEQSINRMISIINDLESISRLESGEFHLDLQRFDIVKLVEEVLDEHESMAGESKIKLKHASKAEGPVYVNADRKRISEALGNLVINSIKYGKKGGTSIVKLLDMDDHILIDVTDNGIGIAEKDLPRIFERFYRTHAARSLQADGTGLGLSIVKHIIEAHNQKMNVQSKPDTGSSFTFTLEKA